MQQLDKGRLHRRATTQEPEHLSIAAPQPTPHTHARPGTRGNGEILFCSFNPCPKQNRTHKSVPTLALAVLISNILEKGWHCGGAGLTSPVEFIAMASGVDVVVKGG